MDTLNEMSRCTELNLNRIAEEMEAKFDFVEENQEMKKENNAKGKKVRQDTDATRGLVTRAKLLKAKDSIAKHENSLAIQGAALKEKKILDDTQNDVSLIFILRKLHVKKSIVWKPYFDV